MDSFHLSERPSVAAAIEASEKCENLEQLYDAIKNYTGHEIAEKGHYTASQIAVRKNDENAPIMIVTEKPEDEDAEEGRPFSGEYGSVMQKAMRETGVNINAVHIAYAVHWLPHGDKSPNKTQIASSRPFLFREIELVKPRAILAQGKGVLEALSGYRGNILEVAGQSMQFKRGDMTIPMFIHTHPKYCLFNGTHFVDFQSNLHEFFKIHGLKEEETYPDSYDHQDAPTRKANEPMFKSLAEMRQKAA